MEFRAFDGSVVPLKSGDVFIPLTVGSRVFVNYSASNTPYECYICGWVGAWIYVDFNDQGGVQAINSQHTDRVRFAHIAARNLDSA
jgi:hypothetical protein